MMLVQTWRRSIVMGGLSQLLVTKALSLGLGTRPRGGLSLDGTQSRPPNELAFMRELMLAIGSRPDFRIWRQNVGKVPVRDDIGRTLRVFTAGPPKGAADLSGIVIPDGWRLEIEVKSARGKVCEHQRRWAEFIERSGGVHVLAQYDPALSMIDNIRAVETALEQAILTRRMRSA